MILFYAILLLSFGLFGLARKQMFWVTLFLELALAGLFSNWAIFVLNTGDSLIKTLINTPQISASIEIDQISAFFILVINLTTTTGILYARGYLKAYQNKSKTEMALHFFSFIWLQISMLLVCSVRDGLSFLIIWELMSLSSFFLVIFESEKPDAIKTGLNYLLQMHIGLAFLLVAFLITGLATGQTIGFNSLESYFSTHAAFPVFLLFFLGFGIKAGFIPLHSWLPHAHPAAPSHVSGVMSGVMIKMGIYGIIRVLTFIHTDLLSIGIFILFISFISGVLGVSLAIVQHDIKKLLAYHSIENIGIIGIGIGVGVIGLATQNNTLTVLGFSGGLLHVLNHSLFKSLLFYAAGNVYQKTHTRTIEKLGGLIKKMPKTAFLFLLGALAISGLPPFNGFISEFLIYLGMFKELHTGDLSLSLLLLGGIVGLVIIGGLALYCFTKVFSIVFLGNARSGNAKHASEVESQMLFPKYIISAIIVLIGVLPFLFLKPLGNIVQLFSADATPLTSVANSAQGISITAGLLVLFILLIWFIRKRVTQTSTIETGPTWGCGYTGAKPAVHQYTATSYANYISNLAKYITLGKKHFKTIKKDEIFPTPRKFETHSSDVFEDILVKTPSNKLVQLLEKIAVFQTGNIQHYLLYAIVFMLLVLLLSILNIL